MHNKALHPTPEASAFFAFAISEQNVAFAKSSLAVGAGDQHEATGEFMNDSELIKQKDGWQTDAEGTDPSVIKNIIYENGLVAEFLNKKNKYFIIASKGVGKTLLLKYKRFILEAQYSIFTNDQKVIFIPQNTPYLDFITDLGSLSKNHRDRLSDYKFARRVWTMSLIISSMSYYNHISVADLSYFSQEIGEMCD